MKIKTKLYLGFGSILIILMLGLGIVQNILIEMKNSLSSTVIDQIDKVKLVNELSNEIQSLGHHVNSMHWLLESKLDIKADAIETNSLNATTILTTLEKRSSTEESKRILTKVRILYDSYIRAVDEAVRLLVNGEVEEATVLITGEAVEKRITLVQSIDELKQYFDHLMDETLGKRIQDYNQTTRIIAGIVVATAFVGMVITFWVLRSISNSLNKVTKVIANVHYGLQGSLPRIEVTSRDEIGKIAVAFNSIVESLEQHAKHEKEYKEMLQEQNWLKTKIAEFSSMYQGVHDLQALAHLFITKITPLVGASFGVFYLKEGAGDEQVLNRLASYAAMEHTMDKRQFKLGEGLVGQAALDRRMIQLFQVPEDYIHITSGLGKAHPSHVMIVPVLFEGEVLAVIELATFGQFEPFHMKLMEQVLGNLGITIHSVAVYMKIEKLLVESQLLTEELQIQSHEMQLQQEELRNMNERLALQYQHSEQKTSELEKVKIALEEKAQQVLISSQYKSEFLANMSHELRTPLNSMLILAYILSENKEGNLTEAQVEYATTIYSSGNDLLRLINEVLDLSKVESGRMELFMSEVRVEDLVQFLERQFVPVANQKGIQFVLHVSKEVPETIFTDEQRLQQILRNLLSNAFKFTEHGNVELSFERVTGNLSRQMLVIRVTDTGIGIPKDKHSLIFEAFRQADGTTSRKYGGTGLGLSICREMAHLLGGYIEVESEEGVGSIFTLFLPIQTDEWTIAPSGVMKEVAESGKAVAVAVETQTHPVKGKGVPHSVELERLAGRQVLIVDDDVRNVFALISALESYQMDVLYANDGREGLEILQQTGSVDLILMDIMMPEMDGHQAIRVIRMREKFREIPIIVLTAKALPQDREKALASGASAFISKPIKLDELLQLIAQCLPTEKEQRMI